MPPMLVVAIALAACLCATLALTAISARRKIPAPEAESILLEEAVVTEPVAPGLEGKAQLHRPDAPPLSLRIKATDASQAFARGDRVRIIDVTGGLCIIENADQKHQAR
jgi:hypothetical protein